MRFHVKKFHVDKLIFFKIFFSRYHRSVDYYKIFYKPFNGNEFKNITISNEGDDSEANDSNQRVSIDFRDGFG